MSRLQFLNQSFKLSNSPAIAFQNQLGWKMCWRMRSPRHSQEVFNSIIRLNPIDVVNNPTIWHWFTIEIFPYFNMFHNIAAFVSPRMFWTPNLNICLRYSFATLPMWRMICFCPFSIAYAAHLVSCLIKHWLAAAWARLKAGSFIAQILELLPTFRIRATRGGMSFLSTISRLKGNATNRTNSCYRHIAYTFHSLTKDTAYQYLSQVGVV